jgi:DNA-binding NarL/FixJ family response regulator
MPVTDGLTVITALRGEFPMLRIVVSSFHADQSTRDGARASGADGYLRKPLQLDELVTLADRPAQGPSDGPETS